METDCDKYIKSAKRGVFYIAIAIVAVVCKDIITPLIAGILLVICSYKAYMYITPYLHCLYEYNRRNKPPFS